MMNLWYRADFVKDLSKDTYNESRKVAAKLNMLYADGGGSAAGPDLGQRSSTTEIDPYP